jgi:hypothetical protein
MLLPRKTGSPATALLNRGFLKPMKELDCFHLHLMKYTSVQMIQL